MKLNAGGEISNKEVIVTRLNPKIGFLAAAYGITDLSYVKYLRLILGIRTHTEERHRFDIHIIAFCDFIFE